MPNTPGASGTDAMEARFDKEFTVVTKTCSCGCGEVWPVSNSNPLNHKRLKSFLRSELDLLRNELREAIAKTKNSHVCDDSGDCMDEGCFGNCYNGAVDTALSAFDSVRR